MDLRKCFTILKFVIILFNCSVWAVEKCTRIQKFSGGSVFYEDGRNVGTRAIYSCRDAFSLFPEDVDSSLCNGKLEWEPVPPKCYKKAIPEVPDNGYVADGWKDFLLHSESYEVCCEQGYEIQSGGLNGTKYCMRIRNNNGNLEPRIQCVEAGCDPDDYPKTDIYYKNNKSLAKTKIPSRTVVILTCQDGYGFYRSGSPMRTHLKRTCFNGTIERAPECEEKKCLFSGYPSSRYTTHREYLSDAVLVADGQYIEHGQAIEVYCYRTDYFELYINASDTYPTEFRTDCRFGKFEKKKEEFPICIERGCDISVSNESCLWTNVPDSCKPTNFKISSGTLLQVGCKTGYTLYQSEDGIAAEVNGTVSVACRRGSYNSIELYKCIPDELVTVLSRQGERFPGELDRVTCRFSIEKSYFCTDPCLIPKIPFGFAKETRSGEIVQFEIGHNKSISVKCDRGYTILNQMTTICRNGEFDVDKFPVCTPNPCKFVVNDRMMVFRNYSPLPIKKGHYTFLNGTILEMNCKRGYKLLDKMSGDVIRPGTLSTCVLGNWTNSFQCVPKGCRVPEFEHVLPVEKQVYAHAQKVTFKCDDGFHFFESKNSIESTCDLGMWSNLITTKCTPDPCELVILEGTSYIIDFKIHTGNDGAVNSFPNGTSAQVVCKNGFKMADMNITIADDERRYSSCIKGHWTHEYHCIPEDCSAPVVMNAKSLKKDVYAHKENISIICEEGFHFHQNISSVVRSFESVCFLGNWSKDIPTECQPDSCDLWILEGISYIIDSKIHTGNDEAVYSFPNGTSAQVVCKNGFKMADINITIADDERRYSTCIKGHWTNEYHCIPDECSAPVVLNTKSLKKDVYAHKENISIICEEGFHFHQNISSVVRSYESECFLGNWSKNIPTECQPDSCDLWILEGTSYIIDSKIYTGDDEAVYSFPNGTSAQIVCQNGFKMADMDITIADDERRYSTCIKGHWTNEYHCIPDECSAPVVMYAKSLKKDVYAHKENITIICEDRFHFHQNISSAIRSFGSECFLGNWSKDIPTECQPDGCNLDPQPGLVYYDVESNNTIIESVFQRNGTTLSLRCVENFDLFNNGYDIINNEDYNTTVTCYYGDWNAKYFCFKRCIWPNNTKVINMKNGANYTVGEPVVHGERVNVTCEDQPDSDVVSTECDNGQWQPEVNCNAVVKSSLPSMSTEGSLTTMSPGCLLLKDAVRVKGSSNVTSRETFKHGENINITCKDDVVSIKCENGRWQPEVNCTVDGNVSLMSSSSQTTTMPTNWTDSTTVSVSTLPDVTEFESGCRLSSDRRYRYTDSNKQLIEPGTMIFNGTSLTVTCTVFDPYAFLSYDDYYGNDAAPDEITPTTVTCIGNALSPFKLDCQEVKDDECKEIQHGDVVKEKDFYYYVTCHTGFTFNVVSYDEKLKCTCENGTLISVHGRQEPMCEPENCIVPYSRDTRMSVINKDGVSLSGGSEVTSEEVVTFDCFSVSSGTSYEPNDRKFKCLNGRWVENDNDKEWKFGKNYTFPKCRKARCEPGCQNGGECYKDNVCRCKNSTEGPRCEKFICDQECFENGGECGVLGKCDCPKGRTGKNCRLATCDLPNHVAKLNDPKRMVYSEGETISNFHCDAGYRLSSNESMACQPNGMWSAVVKCIKNVKKQNPCHNSFDRGHKWRLDAHTGRYKIIFRTNNKWMSLCECKNLCLQFPNKSCVAISYNLWIGKCEGFSGKASFKHPKGPWNARVYCRNDIDFGVF